MTTIDFSYPALLVRRDGAVLVRFRDLPEALTEGATVRDARQEAEDCIGEAIAGRLRRGEAIPRPSRLRRGERLIAVPPSMATKAALVMAMREADVGAGDLARKLGTTADDVRRLLDPRTNPPLGRLQRAMAVLGKRFVVGVQAA
jgi:antitoxin HicB